MWTRFARSGHQGEKTDSTVRNRTGLPVLDTMETTDSRVPNGTDLPVLDTGRKPIPGFEIELGLSPVTKPGLGVESKLRSGRNFEPRTSPNNAVPDFVD